MIEEILVAAVRLSAPLLLAALGELLVERAGLVNIGIEGMMLLGAFAAFAAAVATGSPAAGVLAGAAAGCAGGCIFALFAVLRRADQIVTGTALNLLALGATSLAARSLPQGFSKTAPTLTNVALPGLAELPLLGPAFFTQSALVYLGLLLVPCIALFLARTRPGLRLRAVGESARSADAEGVPVERVRAAAVLAGGALAGIAGATLPLVLSDTFTEGMTAGRGFIALAVVIFGRWRPLGALCAALFFGAATALQFRLQARGLRLPYPVLLMLPHVLTLAVLAFASRGAQAPADLGRPWSREAG